MEQLYLKYERLMFSTARKYVSEPADQKDIVQEAIIKLMKKFSVLRPMACCTLASYIVFTIRNTSIDFLRQQGRKNENIVSLDAKTDVDGFESSHISLEDTVILKNQKAKLRTIIDSLSEEEAFLLRGKYIWGYTDAELAEQLQCKTGSIRMKLTRARRRALEQMEYEEDHDS